MQCLERQETLFLHGNPGLNLPDEVLGPTVEEVFGSQKRSPKPPREILDYYFATRGAQGRALDGRCANPGSRTKPPAPARVCGARPARASGRSSIADSVATKKSRLRA